MEYSMAILLIEKRAYIPEYQDKRINKSDVQKMLRKVNFYKNKAAEAAGYDKMTTLIDIYLKNGKKIDLDVNEVHARKKKVVDDRFTRIGGFRH